MIAPWPSYKHSAAVKYWVDAAREQHRWYMKLRQEYAAETHGRRRGHRWEESQRYRDSVAPLMAEARKTRTAVISQEKFR